MARGQKKERTSGGKGRRVLRGILRVLGTLILLGAVTFGIFCIYFFHWAKSDLTRQSYLKLEDYTLDETSVIYYQDRSSGEWKALRHGEPHLDRL